MARHPDRSIAVGGRDPGDSRRVVSDRATEPSYAVGPARDPRPRPRRRGLAGGRRVRRFDLSDARIARHTSRHRRHRALLRIRRPRSRWRCSGCRPVDTHGRRPPPGAAVGTRSSGPARTARGVLRAAHVRWRRDHAGGDRKRAVRSRRDRALRRRGAVVAPTVFELADDPLAAAVLAGRSGVSQRRLLRLPLLRSSVALAAFVSNRLTELAAINRWKVDR